MRTNARQQKLVEIRLYGTLRRFGESYLWAVNTPAQAVQALTVNFKEFAPFVRNHTQGFRILVDEAPIEDDKELGYPVSKTIAIVPVVAGAAGGGKILAGIALIGLSFTPLGAVGLFGNLTVGSLATNLGISLALGGIAQALTKAPKAPTPSERPENQPSYAFNGAVNLTAQGQCVPLCYGRMRVGSVQISAGLAAVQLT